MTLAIFLQHLLNALQWGSFYALIALGYTMVYGVLLLINFAHGDIFMVGAFIAYFIAVFLLGEGAFGLPITLPPWLILVLTLLGSMVTPTPAVRIIAPSMVNTRTSHAGKAIGKLKAPSPSKKTAIK